jgi:hypothetical protein
MLKLKSLDILISDKLHDLTFFPGEINLRFFLCKIENMEVEESFSFAESYLNKKFDKGFSSNSPYCPDYTTNVQNKVVASF